MATLRDNYEALIEGIEFSTDKKVEAVQEEVQQLDKDMQKGIKEAKTAATNALSKARSELKDFKYNFPQINNRTITSERYQDTGNFNLFGPIQPLIGSKVETEDYIYELSKMSKTVADDYNENYENLPYSYCSANAVQKVTYGSTKGFFIEAQPGDLILARIDIEIQRSGEEIQIGDYLALYGSDVPYLPEYELYAPDGWKKLYDVIAPISNDNHTGLRSMVYWTRAQIESEYFSLSSSTNIDYSVMVITLSNVQDFRIAKFHNYDNQNDDHVEFVKDESTSVYSFPFVKHYYSDEEKSEYDGLKARVWNVYTTVDFSSDISYSYIEKIKNYEKFSTGYMNISGGADTPGMTKGDHTFDFTPFVVCIELYVTKYSYYNVLTVPHTSTWRNIQYLSMFCKIEPYGDNWQPPLSSSTYGHYCYKKYPKINLEEKIEELEDNIVDEDIYTVKFSAFTIASSVLESDDYYEYNFNKNYTYNGQTYNYCAYIYDLYRKENSTIRNKFAKSPQDLVAYLPLTITKNSTTYSNQITVTLYYGGQFKNYTNSYTYTYLFGYLPKESGFYTKDKIVKLTFTENANPYIQIYTMDPERSDMIYSQTGTIALNYLTETGIPLLSLGGGYGGYKIINNYTDDQLAKSYVKLTYTISDATSNNVKTFYAKYKEKIWNGERERYLYEAYWPNDLVTTASGDVKIGNAKIIVEIPTTNNQYVDITYKKIEGVLKNYDINFESGEYVSTLITKTLSGSSNEMSPTPTFWREAELSHYYVKINPTFEGTSYNEVTPINLNYISCTKTSDYYIFYFSGYWAPSEQTINNINVGNRQVILKYRVKISNASQFGAWLYFYPSN